MFEGYLQSTFNIGMTVIIQVIVAVCGVFLIRLIKRVLTRTGIEIDDAIMTDIEDVILKAVSVTNQLLVDSYKNENENHKLTDMQKEEVFNHTKEIIMSSLSASQTEALVKKYGLDIDEVLKLLIENTVYWNHASTE